MRLTNDNPVITPFVAPADALAFNPGQALVHKLMTESDEFARRRGVAEPHMNSIQHAWTSARIQISHPEFLAAWAGNNKENKCIDDANAVSDSMKDQINNFQGREIAKYVGKTSLRPSLIFKRKEMIEDLVMEAYHSGALARHESDWRVDRLIRSGARCNDVSTFDTKYLQWPGPSAAFKAKYGL